MCYLPLACTSPTNVGVCFQYIRVAAFRDLISKFGVMMPVFSGWVLSVPTHLTWEEAPGASLLPTIFLPRGVFTWCHIPCLLPASPASFSPSENQLHRLHSRNYVFSLVWETWRELSESLWKAGQYPELPGHKKPAHSQPPAPTRCHKEETLLSRTIMGAQSSAGSRNRQAGRKVSRSPGDIIAFSSQVLGIRLVASNLPGVRPEFPGLSPPFGSFPSSFQPEAC